MPGRGDAAAGQRCGDGSSLPRTCPSVPPRADANQLGGQDPQQKLLFGSGSGPTVDWGLLAWEVCAARRHVVN